MRWEKCPPPPYSPNPFTIHVEYNKINNLTREIVQTISTSPTEIGLSEQFSITLHLITSKILQHSHIFILFYLLSITRQRLMHSNAMTWTWYYDMVFVMEENRKLDGLFGNRLLSIPLLAKN